MKASAMVKVILVIALMGMICGLSVSSAGAIEYLGEFCWSFTYNENTAGEITPVTGISKYGITNTGGGYYLLQGKGTDDSTAGFFASAVIDGNHLVITAYGTYENTELNNRQTRISQWKLDLVTLNGTVWRTVTRFDTTTRNLNEYYNAGTVTWVKCP